MKMETIETQAADLKKVLSDLRDAFKVLMDLTAADFLNPARTQVLYFLNNPDTLERKLVLVFVEREEKIPSVTDLSARADWYERELYDMFGVPFEGHPDFKRVLMPDDWQGHPMRKDYPLTEESVEFKHGVHPKIPSEIISHVE